MLDLGILENCDEKSDEKSVTCFDNLRDLGRFIKHWASQRCINNRAEGTLSTYTLILQLFYSLQLRNPPVLPMVTDILTESLQTQGVSGMEPSIEVPKAVNHFLTDPEMDEMTGELRSLPFLTDPKMIREERIRHRMNEESLGELLLGFFELWGREEFGGGEEGDGQTVYVYDASCELNDLGVLVMRCPLTGKNVNPFTTMVWRAIHGEFARAARLLRAGCRLEELCEPTEGPPAGCGHRGGGGAEIAAALYPDGPDGYGETDMPDVQESEMV
ncbi:Poly(A) RNA polymerase cid13 (PAP) (Caffeine-induced death protein 13) (Polynucleotide adenylyltransferase cid13) [Durusdinium trenchii]|uniref:Poly(A) RNA polymerase cid13 (PAP) (Caffeine-induced death protein 13) (Polynucleotide adenylyltransferase cid13) n=1 Tax=Durusdinium trenchii TaxID=1381693 RepID=A0ABP0JR03_9DINO